MKYTPEFNEEYFYVELLFEGNVGSYSWKGDDIDFKKLEDNNVFKTRAEAARMAKKVLKVLKEK